MADLAVIARRRSRGSNPGAAERYVSLDCFAALAMTDGAVRENR
jgi:hypothetical protein